MILYRALRRAASIALRWYYRDIEVVGASRIPQDAPVLLAGNHPNALVDALVIGVVVPRPVRLTAKATLAEHPLLRVLFRWVGVVPLRRASDEAARAGAPPDPARNAAAFRAIIDALEERGAVLLFPEGRSHSEPQLAPLRTGLARIALQARDARGIGGLSIVPIGLTFERKWEPRTGVLVTVGEPLALDDWRGSAEALTAAVDARLRAVTLNFPTDADAADVLGVSHLLSGLFDEPRPLEAPHTPLAQRFEVARRVDRVRAAMAHFDGALEERAARLLRRLSAFETVLAERGIPVNDIGLSTDIRPALRFLVRESAIVALAGPPAWWGRLNHWIPLRVARARALRSSTNPDEPAMHTIATGFVLVTIAYAVQTSIVWMLGGAWWALAYLVSLPLAATWDFELRDRMRRARQRIRTWLQLRGNRELRSWLRSEAAWLRAEASALEEAATDAPVPRPAPAADIERAG